MAQISRRNFLQVAGAAGALGALAACDTTTPEEPPAAEGGSEAEPEPETEPETEPEPEEPTGPESIIHDASEYPLDADGDDVEALWSEEETADGWIRVANENGATLGYSSESGIKIIQVDGLAFKDHNGNGKLDLYEDWRQTGEDRAAALADMLTVEETYPLHFYSAFWDNTLPFSETVQGLIDDGLRTTCNNSGYGDNNYADAVEYNNTLQAACEGNGNYGIPHMTAFDPYFKFGIPGNMTQSCTFDPELAHKAGEWLGKAWRALGLHVYYGPQMGLTTDPRWSRLSGGFTEDPALGRDMVQAQVDGLQSTYDEDGNDLGWGEDSIVCQVKHYPGGGACEGGRYDHSDSGKYNVYPNGGFRTTFIPFHDGAFNLPGKTECAGSVMPDYCIFYDEDEEFGENVGVAFDEYKMGLLRSGKFGDNLASSDWDITSNFDTPGQLREGGSNHAWGVEHLTPAEREAKAIKAGMDQFGGEFELGIIADAYDILCDDLGEEEAEALYRTNVRRVFVAMNRLSLFENPYLERKHAQEIFKDKEMAELGDEINMKSMILLKNEDDIICERSEKPTVYVPMTFSSGGGGWMAMFGGGGSKGWSLPFDEAALAEHVNLVTDSTKDTADPDNPTEDDIIRVSAEDIAKCDFALVAITAPSGGQGISGKNFVPISLDFGEYVADGPNVRKVSIAGDAEDMQAVEYDIEIVDGKQNRSYYGKSVSNSTAEVEKLQTVKALVGDLPIVGVVTINNPLVFTQIEPDLAAILAVFAGPSVDQKLRIIAGEYEPYGLLPLQMPKDMDAVEAQSEDVPRDMECYEDSEGNVYDFGFGLNWSGKIEDERTAKYCVEPLTEPETLEF